MTDKQIIIDGVDVSGCCCIENGYCLWIKKYYETGLTPKCEQVKDCYYKQLKAKEQECERLKKKLMQKSEVDMFFNTPLEGWSNDPCGICPYKAENETYKKMLEDEDVQLALTEIRSGERHLWYNKADKLSKTLTEIKEIAEKIDDSGGCAYGDYDCDNCSSLDQKTICTYKVKKILLQKISEVLE